MGKHLVYKYLHFNKVFVNMAEGRSGLSIGGSWHNLLLFISNFKSTTLPVSNTETDKIPTIVVYNTYEAHASVRVHVYLQMCRLTNAFAHADYGAHENSAHFLKQDYKWVG